MLTVNENADQIIRKLANYARGLARPEAETEDLLQEGLIAYWQSEQAGSTEQHCTQRARRKIKDAAERRTWTGREGDDRKNGDVRLVSLDGMAEATGERDFTDLAALQEAGVRYDDEVRESEIDDAVPHAKGNKYGVFPVAVRHAPGFGPNGKEEGNAAE